MALEAIRSIMSDARSGDLEAHGESVPPEIVTGWIREHLEVEGVLAPLSESQARELIRARLDTSAALRLDPRRRLEPLWPIGKARFRRFLTADPTPRRLCALGRGPLRCRGDATDPGGRHRRLRHAGRPAARGLRSLRCRLVRMPPCPSP